MKRVDIQTGVGAGLVILGGLMLLEKLGILMGAASLFWSMVLLLGGVYFLAVFGKEPRGRWWAVIPGMALVGMALESFLPRFFSDLAGLFFLGSLGLAFFLVYLMERGRWWAIIPGGALFTLALVSVLENSTLMDTSGVFFLGLGLTFFLVALLPTPAGKMDWAYIPGLVLLVLGALVGGQYASLLGGILWPVVLIIAGVALIVRFFLHRE